VKLAKGRGEIKKRKRKTRKNWKWEVWMLEDEKEIKEYIKA
jgi:hypothetical protein